CGIGVEAFGNHAGFDGMAVLAGCFGRDAAGKRPGRCRWRSHPWIEMDLNAALISHRHSMLNDEWGLQDLLRRTLASRQPCRSLCYLHCPLSIQSAGDSRQALFRNERVSDSPTLCVAAGSMRRSTL